jgi:hypothetical protein
MTALEQDNKRFVVQ